MGTKTNVIRRADVLRLKDTTAGILNPRLEVEQYEMRWTRKKKKGEHHDLEDVKAEGDGRALTREGRNVSQRKQQQVGLEFEEKGRYVTEKASST